MFDGFPMNFRSLVPSVACGFALLLGSASQAATDSIDLTPIASEKTQHVKVVYEATGKLFSQQAGDKKPQEHPLKAIGNFLYEERVLDHKSGRSIRYFELAESDFEVDGRANSSRIRDDLRWIVVDPNELEDMYVCPTGALSRQELDLVEFPGASGLIDRLLPESEQEVDGTWKHDDTLLALIFNLDAVTVNDVESKLVKVEDDTAYITISGSMVGAIKGVVTEIKLNGKYNFDVQSSTINWVAFGIEEQREIGASTPGLNVKARLRMVRGAAEPPKFVHEQSISQFELNNAPGICLNTVSSPPATRSFTTVDGTSFLSVPR